MRKNISDRRYTRPEWNSAGIVVFPFVKNSKYNPRCFPLFGQASVHTERTPIVLRSCAFSFVLGLVSVERKGVESRIENASRVPRFKSNGPRIRNTTWMEGIRCLLMPLNEWKGVAKLLLLSIALSITIRTETFIRRRRQCSFIEHAWSINRGILLGVSLVR